MTDEHQDTQESDCRILDEEPAQKVEVTDQSGQIDTEDRVQEVETAGPEDVAEQPEQAVLTDEAEEMEEVDSPGEPEQAEASQQDEDAEVTVESAVEAVLFASDEPLSVARLANIVETDTRQVREHIKNLNEKYQANNHAFRIEQIAGGCQMLTLSPYNHWLKKLLRVRSDTKLSAAALETLAIIAYKQPVIRADIEVIRGVAAGEVIRSLAYKGLVKIVGRAEVLGRPMLYGTTKKFLEVFGLNSLKDLPKVEELKRPPS